jgi:ubiquinone/menaquinone biosynthesis C-methylase UbiE
LSDKIKVFNAVAGFYDDWYDHPQGKQVFEAEKKAVNHMIPSRGLGIEIGAGTGVFAESLTTEDRLILCIDPSAEMLRKAKERDLYCILGVGDFLPLRKALIDFNYMITVLEFLNQPARLFSEVKENSKETHVFSVLFINTESSWGDLYREIGVNGDPVFQHARLYSLENVSEMLEEAGYKVSDAKGTLNSDPMNQEVDTRLIEPSKKSGVIIVKAE